MVVEWLNCPSAMVARCELSNQTVFVFFVDDRINIEENEKHAQDERPKQDPERPEEADAAQNGKKNKKRVEPHSSSGEFRPQKVVDEPHRHCSPEKKTERGKRLSAPVEEENRWKEHQSRPDARNQCGNRRDTAPERRIGNAEESESDGGQYTLNKRYREIPPNDRIDRYCKFIKNCLIMNIL